MGNTPEPKHAIRVVVNQVQIGGWTEYDINSSMVEPADAFTMRRPFDPESWKFLTRDARVRVFVDDAPILTGLIDDRGKSSREGVLEISGRDLSGRLVQESAPRINYEGLELTQAILKLAEPWFSKVTLSDARNRKLRMGKSRRLPASSEPIIVRRSARGGGRVQPGEMRWAVIQDMVSQAELICWSSADGRELFVGKPNDDQPAIFVVRKSRISDIPSTCRDLTIHESNGDRYSIIAVVGTGGGTEVDFGEAVSSRRAVTADGPNNDGTGRDFLYPKRLLMPEKSFDSNGDAARVAELERKRRDFKRTTYTADMPYHGQWFGGSRATIFTPNTIAAVIDEDFNPVLEDEAMIYACHYKRSAREGETTILDMVPAGTEIVL